MDPGVGRVERIPIPGPDPAPSPTPDGVAEETVMSLVDHLAELRRRLAIAIVAVLIGGVIGFYFAPQIITLLAQPLPEVSGRPKVQFLTVSGGFILYMKVAVAVGIVLGLPVILYELWAFIAPGLTPRERRVALPWIPLTIVFFVLGVGVAWVTLPFAVAFLTGFTIEGVAESLPSAESYFGFVTMIFLIFGAVMEFPIVLVLLDKLGILSIERLRSARRYVLLGIVIFAVVATPGGDPISPMVMSAVMYALFEFTIFLITRGKRAEEQRG